MNKHLFPLGLNFVQNQKSPAVFFLDALEGKTCNANSLNAISDVSLMPGSLPTHYLGQADRSILTEQDADLIMIDSWADMNFDLWEHKNEGWKCWIHPKYLRNPDEFYETFNRLGKRTLEQSVQETADLVAHLRKNNPEIPVLLLNQQTDYYSKMDVRSDYYRFGELLEQKIPNSYFGGVIPKKDLELADVGSCGAGQTLHFQSTTYLKMFETALDKGLAAKVSRTPPEHMFFADDNSEKEVFPLAYVDFRYESDSCVPQCGTKEKTFTSMKSYINIEGVSEGLRWTPVVIDLRSVGDYAAWERPVKKRYDRVRMKNRSVREGFLVHPFHPKLHVPDIYEIHHSAEVRSGGKMRGDYLKGIDEMGGAPETNYKVTTPKCTLHWGMSFGVFQPLENHKQGEIVTNEKLVGYINLRRFGDIVLYSRIMGHQDHLGDGVMYHLHFDIVKWIFDPENTLTKDVKFIMYGGIGNGGPNLWQWKRTVGFKPFRLIVAAET